ncbi:MAG: DUF1289 domain-containing protein [Deltaproteobacteria bacterium]|nr:DUF1289 domain-containing protein [Deltaproteobacteria bacterium]
MASEPSPAPRIPTPCIAICKIDPFSELCTGCYRSLDEIERWPDLTQEERRVIMESLQERRRAARAPRR